MGKNGTWNQKDGLSGNKPLLCIISPATQDESLDPKVKGENQFAKHKTFSTFVLCPSHMVWLMCAYIHK